jgi:hypothetical protein
MKPLDKAIAVRRNWPFRSADPSIAYRHRIKRARAILDLVEKHGRRPVQYEARRLYIVAVCAAFEAFWRDVIRNIIDEGGVTLTSAPQLGKVMFSVQDVKEILGRKLTLGELVAASYTFQSPVVVDQALSDVLGTKAFSTFAATEFQVKEIPRRNRSKKHGPLLETSFKASLFLKRLPEIVHAFAVRHDTVHDAGARHWPSAATTDRLENAVWSFNEFLTLFVKRYLDSLTTISTRRQAGRSR